MPVVFKQTFNAFNLEFDNYLEVLFNVCDASFCAEVQLFGRELFKYVLIVHLTQSDLPDFSQEVLEETAHGAVLIAGRMALMTAKLLKQSIDEKLTDDFPKFIGTKTNFWRYLLRLVPVYMSEVGADYTKEFAVATACLLELNYYCFKVGQLNLTENCRMFWNAMFLHFFGERFRGRHKCAFLEDFNLIDKNNRGEVESLKIVVKVEVPKETITDGENRSKKSRKRNKKRQK